jgi:uncharacterized membrane protein
MAAEVAAFGVVRRNWRIFLVMLLVLAVSGGAIALMIVLLASGAEEVPNPAPSAVVSLFDGTGVTPV